MSLRLRRTVRSRHGAALLLVVTVVALLTVIVVDRYYEAWVQSALAASFRDDTRAYFRARSGLAAARLILREDARANLPHDALTEEWAQSSIPVPVEDDYVFISLRDESGKLDMNGLTSEQGYPQERFIEIFRRLLTALELDPDLADAVVDWTDKNDEPRPGGGEQPWYRAQPLPYNIKNARLDSVEELALVKGFTPEVMRTILPFVTAWSSGKINLNTAPPQVLKALDDRISDDMVERILRERIETPFRDRIDVKRAPGMDVVYPDIALAVDVRTEWFSCESSATVGETTRAMQAVFHRSGDTITTAYLRMR